MSIERLRKLTINSFENMQFTSAEFYGNKLVFIKIINLLIRLHYHN